MNSHYQIVCRSFHEYGITFEADDENHTLTVALDLERAAADLLVKACPYDDAVSMSLALREPVPFPRRAAVGELLHRLNLGRGPGRLELDYDSGRVHVREHLRLPDPKGASADWAVHWCFLLTCMRMEGILDCIRQVAEAGLSPAHVFEQHQARIYAELASPDPES